MIARSLTMATLVAVLASCAEPPQRSSTPPESDLEEAESVQVNDAVDPEPGPRLLTPFGWGALRIGMSRAEVVAAAGEDSAPDAVGGPDPERCDEFRPRNAPEGVLVMIQEGVLTRVSVSRNSDISTPTGFRVGDSGSAILAEYGARAHVEPHQYWAPPGKYITVWRQSEPELRGIRYEIDSDDRVVHLRGGDRSIENVEGCV
ncbi:MAG TPA: hypothetical protein VK912_05625 [Longimicrobiales bacterium]|nr:hypothetical protein [Longimicrobiales bacterium]